MELIVSAHFNNVDSLKHSLGSLGSASLHLRPRARTDQISTNACLNIVLITCERGASYCVYN